MTTTALLPTRTHPTETAATAPAATTSATTGRDRLYDLLRVSALGIVVLWHWVFTTLTVDGRGFHTGNPVDVTPGLWLATWFLQPMPYFFMVGGALHAISYRSHPERFRRSRFARLALPALPLVLPAVALMGLATMSGHAVVADALLLVISPMWFLAVYLTLVLIAPFALRAHRAHPVAAVAALVGSAGAIDVARFQHGWDNTWSAAAGFVVVWGAVHQFGFFFGRLRRAPLAVRAGVALVGLAGLIGLMTFGPYPHEMVGSAGSRISNMAPPNLTVVFLALFQLGLITMAERPLRRFAERHHHGLEVASSWSMTVFVWHLLAWTLFFLVAVQVGHVLADGTVTGGWWLTRPLWLAGPVLLAIPLVAVTRRFDHR
jgi:hypothetical protein